MHSHTFKNDGSKLTINDLSGLINRRQRLQNGGKSYKGRKHLLVMVWMIRKTSRNRGRSLSVFLQENPRYYKDLKKRREKKRLKKGIDAVTGDANRISSWMLSLSSWMLYIHISRIISVSNIPLKLIIKSKSFI